MNSKSKRSLTIFFPCYNDSGTIASLVAAADIVAKEYTDDYEILVIDDFSIDTTRELLVDLQKKYDRLKLILHEKNRGYGAALKSGFYNASKDLVFYTDGDGQYDVFELRRLLPVMQDGIDIVNGYKIGRADPIHRLIIGALYLRIMRLLFNFHIRDVDCDFRLIRRRVFDTVQLHHDSGVICLEFVKKLELAGYRFVDFPVRHYYRTHGRSQFFRPRHLFRAGVSVIKLWWSLIVRRDTPVRVAYPEESLQESKTKKANAVEGL